MRRCILPENISIDSQRRHLAIGHRQNNRPALCVGAVPRISRSGIRHRAVIHDGTTESRIQPGNPAIPVKCRTGNRHVPIGIIGNRTSGKIVCIAHETRIIDLEITGIKHRTGRLVPDNLVEIVIPVS